MAEKQKTTTEVAKSPTMRQVYRHTARAWLPAPSLAVNFPYLPSYTMLISSSITLTSCIASFYKKEDKQLIICGERKASGRTRRRARGRARRSRCHWTAPTACHPTERTLETEPNAGEALGAIDADAAWAPCGHLGLRRVRTSLGVRRGREAVGAKRKGGVARAARRWRGHTAVPPGSKSGAPGVRRAYTRNWRRASMEDDPGQNALHTHPPRWSLTVLHQRAGGCRRREVGSLSHRVERVQETERERDASHCDQNGISIERRKDGIHRHEQVL